MTKTKTRPSTRKPAASRGQDAHAATVEIREGLGEHRREFEQLPTAAQAIVQSALQDLAGVLVGVGAVGAARTAALVRLRAQTVRDVAEVISRGDTHQLESVMAALERHDPADAEDTGAEVEVKGRLRLQALYQRIFADSYSVKDLTAQWGVSRQRLAQLRGEDRLFAVSVPFQRSRLYPRWQFGEDLRPRPLMPNLIQEAKQSGLDAIDFHQLMTNPASGAGTTPVELLDQGEEQKVLDIIRATHA